MQCTPEYLTYMQMDNLFITAYQKNTVYSHNRIPYRNKYSMKNYSPTQ